jgi:hypothetical protein
MQGGAPRPQEAAARAATGGDSPTKAPVVPARVIASSSAPPPVMHPAPAPGTGAAGVAARGDVYRLPLLPLRVMGPPPPARGGPWGDAPPPMMMQPMPLPPGNLGFAAGYPPMMMPPPQFVPGLRYPVHPHVPVVGAMPYPVPMMMQPPRWFQPPPGSFPKVDGPAPLPRPKRGRPKLNGAKPEGSRRRGRPPSAAAARATPSQASALDSLASAAESALRPASLPANNNLPVFVPEAAPPPESSDDGKPDVPREAAKRPSDEIGDAGDDGPQQAEANKRPRTGERENTAVLPPRSGSIPREATTSGQGDRSED